MQQRRVAEGALLDDAWGGSFASVAANRPTEQ
jgi:hypothetical protein